MKWHSKATKSRAIRLRKKGLSLSEISKLLSVPKNTIQSWVVAIKLSKKQLERLKKKEIECGKRGLRKALKININKLAKWKEDVERRTDAFKTVTTKKGMIAKLICGVLYLCEGAKYPSSRQLIFGSSDPRMIKIFLDLLRKNFAIDENKIRCRIMLRYGQDSKPLMKYWSNLTKIPLTKFYRPYKDRRTKGKITKKKHYRGVCALQYNSTDLQYELQLIGESLYFLND